MESQTDLCWERPWSSSSSNPFPLQQVAPTVLLSSAISRICVFSLQKLLLERVGRTSWEKRGVGNGLMDSGVSPPSQTCLLWVVFGKAGPTLGSTPGLLLLLRAEETRSQPKVCHKTNLGRYGATSKRACGLAVHGNPTCRELLSLFCVAELHCLSSRELTDYQTRAVLPCLWSLGRSSSWAGAGGELSTGQAPSSSNAPCRFTA